MAKRSIEDVQVESYQENASVAVSSFFKGFHVPQDTKFELHRKKASRDEFIIRGENERLEYRGETDPDSVSSKQYLVAVYNPEKSSIQLYKAPVLHSKVVPKSTKNLTGPAIKSSDVQASVLRTALGETFGTKKAKKAIADLERNRIDSDKLADSAVDIVDTVKTASKDLPTRSELENSVTNDRPTPLADVDATDVEMIYPVENIIPKREWNFIRVGTLLKETNQEKRLEMLPYAKSPYLVAKLPSLTQSTQTTKLQLLYYLSLLLGVYENRKVSNKLKLLERLNSPPETLLDGVLERFTVIRAGQLGKSKNRSYFIDPQNEDRLLCYILVIILHLNNFIVQISPLAKELGLKPSKIVSLFRVIGAVVKGATVAQAEAFGIPKSSASTYKIATLKVPFKLPQMTRRGRAR
ncbi:ZYBA0S14-00276g1_1 [Zygosaccharomyces bailii CLIB 213]|uniref:ZYBA0S14-00276g1_1 n=1 Tax=Zygosaccharomyces bailii (strain CLIB 213 / ATCC 58445 / CBS 680 / BCRC 21525 / NBRC 1098 / NCYC 1416 / NRRL Y-2227) TaxID=1333698 RepID=A0A8J2T9Z5_ZYGB2|nr:ZYBA0S14-00276g1_1 [Zygosaccharomyces bailii CLIB 213]